MTRIISASLCFASLTSLASHSAPRPRVRVCNIRTVTYTYVIRLLVPNHRCHVVVKTDGWHVYARKNEETFFSVLCRPIKHNATHDGYGVFMSFSCACVCRSESLSFRSTSVIHVEWGLFVGNFGANSFGYTHNCLCPEVNRQQRTAHTNMIYVFAAEHLLFCNSSEKGDWTYYYYWQTPLVHLFLFICSVDSAIGRRVIALGQSIYLRWSPRLIRCDTFGQPIKSIATGTV